MFTLNEGNVGVTYSFVKTKELTGQHSHLLNLGFIKGADVRIISRNEDGYILLLHHARLAVNKDIVANLLVMEKDEVVESSFQTLDKLTVNSVSHVERILGSGRIRRRLMDMGLTKGVTILTRKVAPLGDPIEISVRGYELTLRKEEAALVLVKE